MSIVYTCITYFVMHCSMLFFREYVVNVLIQYQINTHISLCLSTPYLRQLSVKADVYGSIWHWKVKFITKCIPYSDVCILLFIARSICMMLILHEVNWTTSFISLLFWQNPHKTVLNVNVPIDWEWWTLAWITCPCHYIIIMQSTLGMRLGEHLAPCSQNFF